MQNRWRLQFYAEINFAFLILQRLRRGLKARGESIAWRETLRQQHCSQRIDKG